MPINILTHNDLDGAGCAIITKLAFPTEHVIVTLCDYNSIDKQVKSFLDKDEILYITDISPSEEVCTKLNERNKKFNGKTYLLDHHKTKSWIKRYKWAVFDSYKCGTELTFNFIKNDIKDINTPENKELVNAIRAWDLWDMKSKYRRRGEDLSILIGFIGIDTLIREFVFDQKADINKFKDILYYLKENKDRHISSTLNEQFDRAQLYMDGLGNKFKILFAEDYISEIGHEALQKDGGELNYIVIVSPSRNKCSIRARSQDSTDVEKIARVFRGGGHKSAAGFPFDITKKVESKLSNLLNKINI